MPICGWKTAALEKSMTCKKHDSNRNHESFSLDLSAFTLISLQKYFSEFEQKDGTMVKEVGSGMRVLSSGIVLNFSYY